MRVLVTRSDPTGSEAVSYYGGEGHGLVSIDNNMRAVFFAAADTFWTLRDLKESTRSFVPYDIDVRHRDRATKLFEARLALIIDCSAQPSPDRVADIASQDLR